MTFPSLPGFNQKSAVSDVTETPSRLAALGEAVYDGVISTVDVEAGADDFGKPLTEERPRPVVLVHGTFGNRGYVWTKGAAVLRAAGYRIFRPEYGQYLNPVLFGLGEIRTSAGQLSAFVDKVLERTGAKQVDIVGHSQGGMMPRYYINQLGGAEKVHHLIGLAPASHGLTMEGLMHLARQIPGANQFIEKGVVKVTCPAFTDLMHDSDFVAELSRPGDTAAGVRYTVIYTRCDEVVTPYETQVLTPAADGHQVRNVLLQDLDPSDQTSHLGVTYNPRVWEEVLKALAGT